MSIMNITLLEVSRMLIKMALETQADIMPGRNASEGPPVIKSADTLQSHLSAAVGKVNGQGMKWMAPKRATTPIMVQFEGEISRTVFFSTGE